MDQDDLRLADAERFEAGAHRGLPGGAAKNGGKSWRKKKIGLRYGQAKEVAVVGMYNRLYHGNLGMFGEHGQRPGQQGLASDLPELLGQIAARAQSAPGGDDDGGDVRHAAGAPE